MYCTGTPYRCLMIVSGRHTCLYFIIAAFCCPEISILQMCIRIILFQTIRIGEIIRRVGHREQRTRTHTYIQSLFSRLTKRSVQISVVRCRSFRGNGIFYHYILDIEIPIHVARAIANNRYSGREICRRIKFSIIVFKTRSRGCSDRLNHLVCKFDLRFQMIIRKGRSCPCIICFRPKGDSRYLDLAIGICGFPCEGILACALTKITRQCVTVIN